MAGEPVEQPDAGVDFIPQSVIYEFGYWISPCSTSSLFLSRRFACLIEQPLSDLKIAGQHFTSES
jgi:hypothetical protein